MEKTVSEAQNKRNIRWFLIATFVYWIGIYGCVPIVSAYASTMHADSRMVGLIGSGYGLTMLLLRLPVGRLSDKWDKRKLFIVLGTVAGFLSSLVVLIAPNPWTLFVCRMFCGVQVSTWVPMSVLYARHYPPEESGKALGKIMAVTNLGQLSATLLGGIISNQWGYYRVFVISAAFSLIALVMTLRIREVPTEAAPVQAAEKPSGGAMKAVCTKRVLLLSLTGILMFYVKYGTAYTFTPLIAKELGASDSVLGILTTLFCGAGIPAAMFTDRLAKKLGAHRLTLIAMVLLSFFACVMPLYVKSVALLVVSMTVAGFFINIMDTLIMGQVILKTETRYRATVMGFYQAVYSVGVTLGPILSGQIIDRAGYRPAYLLAGALACAAGVMIRIVGLDRKK